MPHFGLNWDPGTFHSPVVSQHPTPSELQTLHYSLSPHTCVLCTQASFRPSTGPGTYKDQYLLNQVTRKMK